MDDSRARLANSWRRRCSARATPSSPGSPSGRSSSTAGSIRGSRTASCAPRPATCGASCTTAPPAAIRRVSRCWHSNGASSRRWREKATRLTSPVR